MVELHQSHSSHVSALSGGTEGRHGRVQRFVTSSCCSNHKELISVALRAVI